MNYCLFKLKFTTPVHFGTGESAHSLESAGMTFCADTLFSALCITALKLEAEKELILKASAGDIILSDAFPYYGDTLFIPKPLLFPSMRSESGEPIYKKAMKKLKYLPLERLDDFVSSMVSGCRFDFESIVTNFGHFTAVEKVSMSSGEPRPYSVTVFRFGEKTTINGEPVGADCGLYFIVGYTETSTLELLRKLLSVLGANGIGGKTTSGYGKFIISEEKNISSEDHNTANLNKLLSVCDANRYILLTTAAPSDSELDITMDGASYQLARRSGFIYTSSISNAVKKRTQYFFASGSVFLRKFNGELFNVGRDLPHRVYRYSKPLFLGVKL